MKATNDKMKVVPPALLWVLFAAALGGALFLVPRDLELVHRLLADGKRERALKVIEETGSTVDPALLEDGSQSPVRILGPVFDTNLELLAHTFEEMPTGEVDGEGLHRLAAVLAAGTGSPEEFGLLLANVDRLSKAGVERLFGAAARAALGDSEPVFAAEIYSQMRERVASPSPATVTDMVMAYRFAGWPGEALEVMSEFDESGAGTAQEMVDRMVTLCLESAQPGRAFDLLVGEIGITEEPQRRSELMWRASEAAGFAGRSEDMVPLLGEFLSAMPEANFTLQEFADAGKCGESVGARQFVRFGKRYAQLCEWTGRPDEAFDYYCKVAALGDEPAFARSIAIHAGLFRHRDMGTLLTVLAPFEGEKKGERTLLLATLMGRAGHYEKGEETFEEYLEASPDDIDALVALAALRAESGNLEAGLETYRAALRVRPDDNGLRLRAAELHIALGQHEKAFHLFRDIPESEHDDSTLERYLMLASSLAEAPELNRAQLMAFNRKEDPEADDYLDLAESYVVLGDYEAELLVLKGGVLRRPSSQKLALALAEGLYRKEELGEAARLLSRPDLLQNPRALALFIEVCGGSNQFAYAARHLPKGVEDRYQFSPSVRIELAEIYQAIGELAAAKKLFDSVPPGGEAWQLLASAKYRRGDVDRAEEYQLKYLNAAEDPDPSDWMFMGDIYKSLGKAGLSQAAYRRSLGMLKSGL